MPRLHPYHFLILIILVQASSCTSLNITNYYRKNQSALDSIEAGYRKAYLKKPFSIEFTDRPFNRLSLELVTDTLTYIYEYTVGEPRLQDTLLRYGYDTAAINSLITDMRSMECTWIDNLDYYTEERKHSLISISLWPRVFTSPFANRSITSSPISSNPNTSTVTDVYSSAAAYAASAGSMPKSSTASTTRLPIRFPIDLDNMADSP